MAGGVDPVEFGEVKGTVNASYDLLKKIDERQTVDASRIDKLESRNEYVKESWKKAGIISGIVGMGAGILHGLKSLFEG